MGKRASVDIETTGTEPAGVAVLSVGIVMFDDVTVYDNVAEVGFWRMDPRWVPGRRDKATHEWWETQSAAVRAEAFGGIQLPWDFCAQFSNWIAANEPDEVWANPARFDLGHLRELFHQMGVPFPVSYRKERDLPTLKATARAKAAELDRRHPNEGHLDGLNMKIKAIYEANKAEHSALADAIEQAHQIRALHFYLGAS